MLDGILEEPGLKNDLARELMFIREELPEALRNHNIN